MRDHLADVINHAKFCLNQIRGFDSMGLWGSNFWLSHRKEKSPLTHGLNYRSACDLHISANVQFSSVQFNEIIYMAQFIYTQKSQCALVWT